MKKTMEYVPQTPLIVTVIVNGVAVGVIRQVVGGYQYQPYRQPHGPVLPSIDEIKQYLAEL